MFLSALLYWCISCAPFCRKSSADGGWPGHIIPAAPLHPGVLHQALPPRSSPTSLQWVSGSLCFCHGILAVTRADKELVYFCRSESAISKAQSPPGRTARRSQSKAKSRPPESEVDLQLLKTLCQENDCNSEEVWAPHPVSYRYTIVELLAQLQLYKLRPLSHLRLYFSCRWRMCTRPVSQLSWTHSICQDPHIFLRSVGLIVPTPASLFASLSTYFSIADLILFIVATIEQVCDSCWLPPLRFLPVCFHIIWCQENVCSGRGLFWGVNSTLQS